MRLAKLGELNPGQKSQKKELPNTMVVSTILGHLGQSLTYMGLPTRL